jgi:hypothetical protein
MFPVSHYGERDNRAATADILANTKPVISCHTACDDCTPGLLLFFRHVRNLKQNKCLASLCLSVRPAVRVK